MAFLGPFLSLQHCHHQNQTYSSTIGMISISIIKIKNQTKLVQCLYFVFCSIPCHVIACLCSCKCLQHCNCRQMKVANSRKMKIMTRFKVSFTIWERPFSQNNWKSDNPDRWCWQNDGNDDEHGLVKL